MPVKDGTDDTRRSTPGDDRPIALSRSTAADATPAAGNEVGADRTVHVEGLGPAALVDVWLELAGPTTGGR